jgi:hypothetical protein
MTFALLLGFAVPTQATADLASTTDHLPEVAPPAIEDPISDAEMEDLRTLADQRGVPLRDVIDRYAWNDNFALAVQMIRETTPEGFTGAEIVDADTAWIAFAGGAPREALDKLGIFTASHGDVSVEVRTNLGFTETELQRAIEEVHYTLLARPEVSNAATTFDFGTGQITTRVVLASAVPDSVLGDLRLVAANSLIDAAGVGILDSIATSVFRSDLQIMGGDDGGYSYHMGGEILSTCTSGFGTRQIGTGVRGISTAGHCSNSQSDDGSSLTFMGEHNGTHGDFQWHTGPKTENDNFYSGSSTITEVNERDVSSVGAPVVGQSLCMNGKTTQKHCQEVRRINVCYDGRCNLVQMGARHASGGDSGGPWFWGTRAYGLHQSWMYDPFWPYNRDLFSRADRIDNALGINIATS